MAEPLTPLEFLILELEDAVLAMTNVGSSRYEHSKQLIEDLVRASGRVVAAYHSQKLPSAMPDVQP